MVEAVYLLSGDDGIRGLKLGDQRCAGSPGSTAEMKVLCSWHVSLRFIYMGACVGVHVCVCVHVCGVYAIGMPMLKEGRKGHQTPWT